MSIKKPVDFIGSLRNDIDELKEDLLGAFYEKANNKENPDPFMGAVNSVDIKVLKNRVRSFYLVAHAEIQSYLEHICDFYVKRSYALYIQEKKITELFLFFISTYDKGFAQPIMYDVDPDRSENSNKALLNTDTIEKRYEIIKIEYNDKIKNNNGVKKKNLFILLHPLGITIKTFEDLKLTPLLDEFGKKRGEFAHTALHNTDFGVVPGSNIIDLDVIYQNINNIIISIEEELLPLLDCLIGE